MNATIKQSRLKLHMGLVLVCGLLAALAGRAKAQSISEPHTVFYGKVLGTGSEQPFPITTGQLSWTIQRADGATVTLQTSLFAYHNNTFSYRLDVPHSAFALGVDPAPGDIPMPVLPQVNVHLSVLIDGQAATLLGPSGSAFTTEQILRMSTYRLDLGLARKAIDTDDDGIPDWWEETHGLDMQDASDALGDLSGDGLSAREAYLRGLDPTHDARIPVVLTDELIVYPSGTTAILLDTVDVDSTSEALVYTLTGLPAAGTLTLRQAEINPAQPDRVLSLGGQFTQADVLRGRVVYDHNEPSKSPGTLTLSVHDGETNHPPMETAIELLSIVSGSYVAQHLTDLEAQRVLNYHHAAVGYVVMDAVSLPRNTALAVPSTGFTGEALATHCLAYGDDRRALLVGAAGESWSLAGGQQADVLMPGAGSGTLAGGLAADAFVFRDFGAGRVTVEDFDVAEGDEIDFSALPATAGAYVHQHLRLVSVAEGFELRTDLDGDGAGFTNLCVVLPDLSEADADLYRLIGRGNLVTGLRLLPRISVKATVPQAAENGPVPGQFTITRQGDLSVDLSVDLDWSGTAENGKDYMKVSTTILLPAGSASREIVITPNDDGIVESRETVYLVLKPATDDRYILDVAATSATVTIDDLRMVLTIEANKVLAVKDPLTNGRFIIRRSGMIQSPVDVFLTIGGTAANGQDYESISDWIPLAANQVTFVFELKPKVTATLTGGAETVEISIAPDAAYLTLETNMARVVIIEHSGETFSAWRQREFTDQSQDLTLFANQNSGVSGLSHFQRYAYGMDPHLPKDDGLPRPFMHQGRLAVTFRKPLGVTDVTYTVRGLTDLRDPVGSQVPVAPMPAPQGLFDPQRVYYTIDPAAADAPCAFIEVKAEWKP